MTAANTAAGAMGVVPRDYNFAADVLARNLAAGRADKPAYIDGHRTLTYRQLADRVARFAAALRRPGRRRAGSGGTATPARRVRSSERAAVCRRMRRRARF